VDGEQWNSKIFMDSSISDVPRCTSSNEKTFGLKRLQLPNMVASNGPPDGLLVEQESIFDYPSIYKGCKCTKREQQSIQRLGHNLGVTKFLNW
jgi:hypothetical protein